MANIVKINPYNKRSYIDITESSESAADVQGPASSTDNALARFDGVTGKLVQNSNAILDDNGGLSLTAITADIIPLTINLAENHTGNALRIRNSSGLTKTFFDKDGYLRINAATSSRPHPFTITKVSGGQIADFGNIEFVDGVNPIFTGMGFRTDGANSTLQMIGNQSASTSNDPIGFYGGSALGQLARFTWDRGLIIGTSTSHSAHFLVEGIANEVQQIVKANSTQTGNSWAEWRNSSDVRYVWVNEDGEFRSDYGTGGQGNYFVGGAGNPNITGIFNVGIGDRALEALGAGNNMTAIGYQAGYQATSANRGFMMGFQAGASITTADDVVLLGYQAGASFSTPGGVISIGYQSMAGATNFIDFATSIGYRVAISSRMQWGIAIGYEAWINANGSYSVALGYRAGNSAVSANSVFIGKDAGTSEASANRLHIANSATQSLIYGEFDNKALTFNGSINVVGQNDVVQQTIRANSTQTTDWIQYLTSGGTKYFHVNRFGTFNLGQPTEAGFLNIRPNFISNTVPGVYVRDTSGASYTGKYFQANSNGTDVWYVTRSLMYSAVDIQHAARIIRSKSIYTGTDTTDDVYLHICDSASAFTLTVTDGADDSEEIKIVNRGAGTVTLSGKISATTALTSLVSGESVVLNWDTADDEWQ